MHILQALIYFQSSIPMPHLGVMHWMCVIKCPQSDSDGSCVNKNVRGNKGVYSTGTILLFLIQLDLVLLIVQIVLQILLVQIVLVPYCYC